VIFFRNRGKGSTAYGTEGRGNFRKAFKAGPTDEKLFLILFRPVAPEESFTDMTSRGIDNIDEFVEDVHCITTGSIRLFQFFWQ
jgi:hypothetical protein